MRQSPRPSNQYPQMRRARGVTPGGPSMDKAAALESDTDTDLKASSTRCVALGWIRGLFRPCWDTTAFSTP